MIKNNEIDRKRLREIMNEELETINLDAEFYDTIIGTNLNFERGLFCQEIIYPIKNRMHFN
jgi:hypothetical protein